jgi:cyclopropane-fatty-acyl-phospholipid synthase
MERSEHPSIIPAALDAAASSHSAPLARLGRRILLGALERWQHGELRVIEGGHEHRFGTRTDDCPLAATIFVDDPQMFADAAFGGTVGAGEAYIRGSWHADDLTAVIRLFLRNRELMSGLDRGWARVSRPFVQLFHAFHRNTRAGSARNIAAHYDLGNEFYALILDETMTYSCGIFERDDSSLREAQVAKFEAACRKLALQPGERVLEIGTGWGGLAMHAAERYGVKVTTTTISREQRDYAIEAIARRGLADRVEVLFDDYRDLAGRYDKLVSIEMIEAVGAQYLDTYLAQCSRLLEPHGAMLLQAITIRDQHYAEALRGVDYIQRFVFPGSFMPSLTAIGDALARVTDLKIFHLEDIGPHYARTLRTWRERFTANLAEVRRLGFPDSFVRLWEYYLCYCEGGFAERQLGDAQILLTKPLCRRAPFTQAY